MTQPDAPLAERMRPHTPDGFVGQEHLLGEGAMLTQLIAADTLPSLIFWGEPGTGKTTLARILARTLDYEFVQISAVMTGVPELRRTLETARRFRAQGRRTLLFVDEIHRWSKAQQDALLHAVEDGTVTLLGATTENHSFEVIAPLLSRTRVLRFQPLGADHLRTLLHRALETDEKLKTLPIEIPEDGETALLALSGGDARMLYNALELAVEISPRGRGDKRGVAETEDVEPPLAPPQAGGNAISPRSRGDKRGVEKILINRALIEHSVLKRMPVYDKKGDAHYDTISAFIKSVRASDPDAAVYYLARMLNAGEDPLFVARRLIILASEDIGNANPTALVLANAGYQAVHQVGMPEARIILAQVTTYLASSPKSNAAYKAISEAMSAAESEAFPAAVPLHLRNPVTGLMQREGYGKGYVYPHDHPGHFVESDNLPPEYKDKIFYDPSDQGREAEIAERLKRWWKKRRKSS
ncbi:MAG: replication-associated recombination protein A [bacterium]|nr:replication-associated recombination protein A [bacterium]